MEGCTGELNCYMDHKMCKFLNAEVGCGHPSHILFGREVDDGEIEIIMFC
jgi:hypothetical protein